MKTQKTQRRFLADYEFNSLRSEKLRNIVYKARKKNPYCIIWYQDLWKRSSK